MGVHKKIDELLSLRPDLLILPECAEPDVLREKAPHFTFSDCEWSGNKKHKGLGSLSGGCRSAGTIPGNGNFTTSFPSRCAEARL
jgi:hypothetical protein